MSDSKILGLRKEVKWFAEEMEKVLQENNHKEGWANCSFDYLIERINSNLAELTYELSNECDKFTFYQVKKHAIDIANFAMMIADNAIRLSDGKLEYYKPTNFEAITESPEKLAEYLEDLTIKYLDCENPFFKDEALTWLNQTVLFGGK